MKNFLLIIFSLIIAIGGGLMLSACNDLYSNVELRPSVKYIEIEVEEITSFEVQIENYNSNISPNVSVSAENGLVKVLGTEQLENGKTLIEIQAIKVGEESLLISTFEGAKRCVVSAKIIQPTTDFALKTKPYIIKELNFSIDFSKTNYFNFFPQNATRTDVSFYFNDNGNDEKVISASTKEIDDNLVVVLETETKQIIINSQSFALTAKLDNYPQINSIEFDMDVVEPIEIGAINVVKRGIYEDFFPHDEIVELSQIDPLILISNDIENSFFVIEIQVESPKVKFEIVAQKIELEKFEPVGFDPTSPFSYFFSIQSGNLGTDTLKIKAYYEDYEGYEILRTYPINSISMPDKLYVNDKASYDEPIYLYDKNFGNDSIYKFDLNLTVYASDSIFESVSFSIETDDSSLFPAGESWKDYIIVNYKNIQRTNNFTINYNDFINNSLKSPISLVGKKQFENGALRIKLEVNSTLLGEKKIVYYIPILIKEGGTRFEIMPMYAGGLSLDIENGEVGFFGLFVESNSAYIGKMSFEYLNNSDLLFKVEQIQENDIGIEITPFNIGQGRIKITLPNGLSVILLISVEKSLNSAKLSVLNSREISFTENDANGNVSNIAIDYSYQKQNQVNQDPLKVMFKLLLNPYNATLYKISYNILEGGDFISFDLTNKSLFINGTGTARIKIMLDLLKIINFSTENAGMQLEFEVEIKSYYPLSNFSFKQGDIEKNSVTVYKKSDVGYYYAKQGYATVEIDLAATLFDGTSIYDVFMTYENSIYWTTELGSPYEDYSSSIGGNYSANGTINNFGEYKINGNHLQLDCNSHFAQTNVSFWIAFTISEYNVSKTAVLRISILDYTPLYSVGFFNYAEEIYLSDSNPNYVFNTFINDKSDCQEFDVVFEPYGTTSESLVSATINANFTEVIITYNHTQTGYGTLFFIPRSSYTTETNYIYFSAINVWVSDGTDPDNPLIINSAEEFISTMMNTDSLSKHFKIVTTLDFDRLNLPTFGEFKGSLIGTSASSKLINVKINSYYSEESNNFFGIFSKLASTALIKNLSIVGEISINLPSSNNIYVGLIAGQNYGKLENISVVLKTSNIVIKNDNDVHSISEICVGGIVGKNAGLILNSVDFNEKTFNHTLLNQTAKMQVRYEGYSTNVFVGGVVGDNSGVIIRNIAEKSCLYNTSVYGAIVNISTKGVNATGGVVGINRLTSLDFDGYTSSEINNYLVTGEIKSERFSVTQQDSVGGINAGGICGINSTYIQFCTSRVQINGYNFVGGIVGKDDSISDYILDRNPDDFDFINNCKVQAVYNASFKYMLTALSSKGNIGAISGNETSEINENVYDYNLNTAKFYYEMSENNKIFPIAYSLVGTYENIKFNANDEFYCLFKYESIPINAIDINSEDEFGAGKLITENIELENLVAYMFFYNAKNSFNNKYIEQINFDRNIPFIFENSDSLTITSLTTSILDVTTDGKINLRGTGLATIKISSKLNSSINKLAYIFVTDAFDGFRILASNTYEVTSDSHIVVYENSPVQLTFEFNHSKLEMRDEFYQLIWVEVENNNDATLECRINEDNKYINISSMGKNIILQANQTGDANSTNTITFLPKFELNLGMLGNVYMARGILDNESGEYIDEFEKLITKTDREINIIALSKKGTEKINVSFSSISAEPLDIITIDVVQSTDYENDYLKISSVKAGDEFDAPDDYFLILEYSGYDYNIDENRFEYLDMAGRFLIQFNFEKYALENFDYTGTYYVNLTADNGVSQTIIIYIEKQEMSNIALKNYYNIQPTFNLAQKEENYVAAGSTNLLSVEIYPYFSDFDYVEIENSPINRLNGSTLVLEVVKLTNENKLQTIYGVSYTENGVKIPKSIIKEFTNNLTSAKIFIKYTTTSTAVIDSVAELNVSAIKLENGVEFIKFSQSRCLSVIIKDKVSFSIVGRKQVDGKYYVARGLSYELDLDIHGFSERQIKIESTSNYATINKVDGVYTLFISSLINYMTEEEGFEITITTYGENTIDGFYYTSEISAMNLIVVDYVILTENINNLDMSSAWLPDIPGMPSREGGLSDYNGYTIIKNGSNGTVRIAIGNTLRFGTEFLNGLTIEYDTSNPNIVSAVREFSENIAYQAEWGVVSDRLGIVGDYIKQTKLSSATNIMSAYMRIVPEVTTKGLQFALTPLKINIPSETAYYFTFSGEFKYANGRAVFNKNFEDKNRVYSLNTHFVTDVYSTGAENNAIPIYSYTELVNMNENGWYILMNDLNLPNVFEPLNIPISGFNGNGYNIFLPTTWNVNGFSEVGFFGNVGENTILKNITINLVSRTNIRINCESSVNFGFISGINSGILTNCAVIADKYVTATITIDGQLTTITDNYVAGIAGRNNGYITNSRVEATIIAVANVAGFVGINQNLISSSYVKESRIVNKGGVKNRSAGFVIRNGLSVSSTAHISTSYVSGAYSDKIYSDGDEKILSSDKEAAGFVFDNYAKITDCYSNIPILSNSYRTGFVFNNAGLIKNTYSTSTFGLRGETAYGFIVNNHIETHEGTVEQSCYLLGNANHEVNIIEVSGLTSLSESDFLNPNKFNSYIISSSTHKTGGIWFYPSKTTEIDFVYRDKFPSFIYGKPELVAPNLIADSQKQLDTTNIKVDPLTGVTSYAYYETKKTEGDILNPFIISTASEFEKTILKSSNRNVNSNYFRLVSLIDYDAEIVGNSQVYKTIFMGELEGNNMTIAGFVIDTKESLVNGGLFSKVGNGSTGEGYIKNLNLKPRYMNLPNTSNVGTLAGSLESGKIYNVSVNGFGYSQQNLTLIGHYSVGGVVGVAINNFTIKNAKSSMSTWASYTSSSLTKVVGIYNTRNTTKVSYAGSLVGVANGGGSISYVNVENNIASLAEIAGLMFGKIGTGVTVEKIDVQLNENQFVKGAVYGGIIAGENCGIISDVKISGETQVDFFKFESISPSAVGGIAGLSYAGEIKNAETYVNLCWSEATPTIVGGIAGEMLGGTISNAKVGGKIFAKEDSTLVATSGITVGGIVGKISYQPSPVLNIVLTASNSLLYDCVTLESFDISVETRSVYRVFVGGIVGEIINRFETYMHPVYGENYVKSAYKIELNKCKNSSDIKIDSIFYGGTITTYVGGLVGGAFSEVGRHYAGEVIIYDNYNENTLNEIFASSSISHILVKITDLKSDGLAKLYFGGIFGYGYPVKKIAEINGTPTALFEFGQMLEQAYAQENDRIVCPNYAGQYTIDDDDNLIPIENMESTDYLSITIILSIANNASKIENNYYYS